MNTRKRITVAGFGTVGRFAHETFAERHECAVYDPPLGIGSESDLQDVDFVLVCVPTPPATDGGCDTRAVEDVVQRCRVREAVIVLSTVSVGSTERIAARFGCPVVFSPEYAGERPDHPYRDRRNRSFFIFGGERAPAEAAAALFKSVYGPGVSYHVVPSAVAEMTKYMENAFLATKVAFVNEFFDLCLAANVPFEEVRRLWLHDGRIGESHTLVTAERGYAGSCLPKDVSAICTTARTLGAPLEILEAVQRANKRHRGTR